MSAPQGTLDGAGYRAALAASMTEASLLASVRHLAQVHRWRAYHTHDSRRSDPGFPDLVLVCTLGTRGVLFVELKTAKGRVTAAQREWLADLASNGSTALVWRPEDLLEGRVEAVLRTGVAA